MSGPRIAFWVQHLLGIGHIRRASLISQALAANGFDVTVIVGGFDVEAIDYGKVTLAHLPPAKARDEQYSAILDADGCPISDTWKAARAKRLMDLVEQIRPDILMFDLFPFGRRQFRFELIPLLDFVSTFDRPPLVVSSARDILVKKTKPGRLEEQVAILKLHFDTVLVHGDPSVIRFGETFPLAEEIADRIVYTGYIAPPAGEPAAQTDLDDSGDVLVSAGGGILGAELFQAALKARPLSNLANQTWRILTGPNLPAADLAELRKKAEPGVEIEVFRPDLSDLMRTARLSISQGGYNTTMDVLRAGVPAVIVPIDGNEETEQEIRSNLLAKKGLISVVNSRDLSAKSLAEAVDKRADRPRSDVSIDLDGSQKTADILRQAVNQRTDDR